MHPDRWQQISQVYHAALARPAPERAGFLREACAGDDALHQEVASLLANESYAAGAAVALFQARLLNGPSPGPRFRQQYDVAPEGQRFLLNVPLEDAAASSITVVLNWHSGLEAREKR